MSTYLLRRELKSITKAVDLAAMDAQGRFNMSGVHLAVNGHVRATVTDGHALLRVTQLDTLSADDFPVTENFPEPAAEATETIVPGDAWKTAFEAIPKASRIPVLGYLAVKVGTETTSYAATDLDTARTGQLRPIAGTFPNVDSVVPKGRPKATVVLDGRILKRILDAWCAMQESGQAVALRIDVRGPEDPVVLSGMVQDGALHLSGLIMPMRGGADETMAPRTP